jgi:hypothetical protein
VSPGFARGRRRPALVLLVATAVSLGLLVIGLAAAAVGGGAHAPASAAAGGCSAQFGSFSAGRWPPACWRPYGSSSPFNRRIPGAPRLAPESSAIVAYMRSQRWSFPSEDGRFSLPAQGSRPVFWSGSGDPVVTVICRRQHFTCRRMRLHMPSGARPQDGSDGHMAIIDQALGREFDLWQAGSPEHGQILAAAASSIPIGPESGTGLGGQAEAAYLGLVGGLIRAPELAAGSINHALSMAVACVQWRDVWPAPSSGRGDAVCGRHDAGPHLGSLLQLNMSDAEIGASGAPVWQQGLMRAMAHYGIYVVDTNGAGNDELSLIKEDDLSFTSFGYEGQMSAFSHSQSGREHLLGVPVDVSRFRVVAPCVPHGTC